MSTRTFQVALTDPAQEALVRVINDALRQIRDEFDSAMPSNALILWPDGTPLPRGWVVADGTGGTPDLRAHTVANFSYIVRK